MKHAAHSRLTCSSVHRTEAETESGLSPTMIVRTAVTVSATPISVALVVISQTERHRLLQHLSKRGSCTPK
eukprot:3967507-Pleurochrysis_carterae.AAC.1